MLDASVSQFHTRKKNLILKKERDHEIRKYVKDVRFFIKESVIEYDSHP